MIITKIRETFVRLKIYGLRKFLRHVFYEIYACIYKQRILYSYTQDGEDIFIDEIFKNKRSGFYIDVGANDPTRLNNTRRFYDKGWHGINIEPDRKLWMKLKKGRPRDINLNFGVGNRGKMIFYKFFPDTLSTFYKYQVNLNLKNGYKLEEKNVIKVVPLSAILKSYASRRKIDLLSVDTEGMDLEVLKSNDWRRFKPTLICVEVLHFGEVVKKDTRIESFLTNKGYKKLKSFTVNSIFGLRRYLPDK